MVSANRGGPCLVPYQPKSAAVRKAIEEAGDKAGGLVTILEALQEQTGTLERPDLEELSQALSIPLAEIYGVATFYSHFRLSKAARHTVQVCTGTACHVRGNEEILAALRDKLGIGPGEATADGRYSLETVRCFGACAQAPIVRVDKDTYGKVTRELVPGILDKYE